MRSIALMACLALAACGPKARPAPLFTKGQLATVERAVTYCTAASAKLTPLIAKGDRIALANAAIDARDRCSTARTDMAAAVGRSGLLDACRKDVDAQERASVAQLALLDAYTIERRNAVLGALDEAIPLQTHCGAEIAKLRSGE